jgi:acyl-coenzyme A thioesterase PaaI-like protein
MSDASDFVFDPARMFRAMERYGHSAAMGFKFGASGDDWAELVMPWRADLVGDVDSGTPANGAVIALMDMSAGMAVWVKLGHFRPQATLDLRIDYLRTPAPQSALTGHATCYRVAREIAFVRGIAHDGDASDPVANMAATFMFTGPPMAPRGSTANPVGGGA